MKQFVKVLLHKNVPVYGAIHIQFAVWCVCVYDRFLVMYMYCVYLSFHCCGVWCRPYTHRAVDRPSKSRGCFSQKQKLFEPFLIHNWCTVNTVLNKTSQISRENSIVTKINIAANTTQALAWILECVIADSISTNPNGERGAFPSHPSSLRPTGLTLEEL